MGDTSTLALTVPQMALSVAGREFNPASMTWPLSKDVTLNLEHVLPALAPPLRSPYRMVMQYYAENQAARYCENIHAGVQKFLTDMDVDRFSRTALRTYRASLSRDTEYRLGTIRAFLTRWHDQGYPGVSAETAKWLTSVKLKGNRRDARSAAWILATGRSMIWNSLRFSTSLRKSTGGGESTCPRLRVPYCSL